MKARLKADFIRRFAGGAEIRVEGLRMESDPGVTILFGASGAGKSTILRCLAGLDAPDEGRIEFDGEVWFDSAQGLSLPPQRRRIGYVPQEGALFPHLTVEGNVAYGLRRFSAPQRCERVRETIRRIGLDGLEQRRPHELSGGQRQRVALARAAAREPGLMLLDEPFSALDVPTRRRLRAELQRWFGELRVPAMLVTHDRTEALMLGSRIILLNEGRIEQTGPVVEVFNRPASLAAARVAGMETVAPGRIVERQGGLAVVEVAGVKLFALAEDVAADAQSVHVCIRAEDVILTQNTEMASSARNRLSATVVSVHFESPLAAVELDCGFPLKALITRQAQEELRLRPGSVLAAWVKAPHIHLIAS